jgi:hypothetical protein
VIPLPKNTIDETGRTYGQLKVLEFAGVRAGRAAWLCECACGNRKVISSKQLRATGWEGRAISCGCMRANPDVRRAARMVTPARRREEIASMGGEARRAQQEALARARRRGGKAHA